MKVKNCGSDSSVCGHLKNWSTLSMLQPIESDEVIKASKLVWQLYGPQQT